MAWTPDLSNAIPPPQPLPAQLSVTLPGGLSIAGVPQGVGPSALVQAQALLGAAGPALAPLAPFFSMVQTLLAVKEFAEAVPGILTGGVDKVVEAITKLVRNADALLATLPPLSVPVAVAGVLDVMVQFLSGLAAELSALALQEARIADALTAAENAPALLQLIPQAEAQLAGSRAAVVAALASAGPLVELVNELGELAGLPTLSLGADAASGSLSEAAAALAGAASELQRVRGLLPF